MHIDALVFLFALAAPADEPPHAFIAGRPMLFPMTSAGIAEDLVRRFSANCNSDSSQVQSKCLSLMHERAGRCKAQPPEVFEDRDAYKAWAGAFSACIFPRPICSGVEVTSLEECRSPAR